MSVAAAAAATRRRVARRRALSTCIGSSLIHLAVAIARSLSLRFLAGGPWRVTHVQCGFMLSFPDVACTTGATAPLPRATYVITVYVACTEAVFTVRAPPPPPLLRPEVSPRVQVAFCSSPPSVIPWW